MDDRNSEASDAEAYARAWEAASPLLQAQRLAELRALTELEAARRFAQLLALTGPYPLRSGSGLIEQQRVFNRLRRHET